MDTWKLTRGRYVQIAKNMLKKVHVNYYHGYFLRSDLTTVPLTDASEVTVRPLRDSAELTQLPEKERGHFDHFFTDGDLVVGAFRGDAFLGFLVISLYKAYLPEIRQERTFDGAYFWSGHIFPQFRNQGLGRILVNHSLELLRSQYGITSAYMMIEADNIPSQRMVAHNGFHPYKSVRFLELGRFNRYSEADVEKKRD